MKTYTVAELQAMPTICQSQESDLKIETPTLRVWLSRMGPEDGEIYQIHHEELTQYGSWVVISEYAPFLLDN